MIGNTNVLECPKMLTNEFKTEEDIGRVTYMGFVWDLNFDEELNLCCGASIGKKVIRPVPATRRFSLRHMKKVDVPATEQTEALWHYETLGRSYLAVDAELSEMTGFHESDFKGFLMQAAKLHGVCLSPLLFQNVFAPLEQQLLEFYTQAMGSRSSQSSIRVA